MHLIVGLGNPGAQYAGNRHNVGFMLIDRLAEELGQTAFRDKFRGEFCRTEIGESRAPVVLLKPMTFMNLSGESVQAAMRFFQTKLPAVIVAHDELDLPFGTLRIKVGGGLAGHNGLKSIAQHCGGQDFVRLRIGIGRPRGAGKSHVLSDFSSAERAELPDLLDRGVTMTQAMVKSGPRVAMNEFH